ncbi:MAG TPA: undecaprenyldiphospho-muramoylpentapeptide beta-N-acetylglucosaminyltransferase [Solirubrobacteraceae bacterium]|nr:undecaprenyldiphospho-muramoylpentapeptide beta-N-acetylglucosaminyltransferase [Solirubrobacteraceae bacterium]
MSPAKRIVIAAGGTAGHVVPALAVADALRADGAEVTFIGGERAEATLVPAAGFELHRISVEGLSRSHPLKALRALARAALALPRSRSLLRSLRADAVLGGGGYVSAPVGLAALSLRVPLVLSEADSHLGLSNRVLAPFARRVCLAFPIAGRDGPRYRVTGRPVPAADAGREAARRRFGVPADAPCVLVFGGSLGARSINLAAAEAFARAPFEVIHISGRRDYAELAALETAPGYHLFEYLDVEQFGEALDAADLAVARAGGSVFELAAHGLPAILVPYPHASADHQSTNARWMAEAGAAVTVADAQLDAPLLSREVEQLLGDRPRLAEMARAARSLARPDAAASVAGELLAAAGR